MPLVIDNNKNWVNLTQNFIEAPGFISMFRPVTILSILTLRGFCEHLYPTTRAGTPTGIPNSDALFHLIVCCNIRLTIDPNTNQARRSIWDQLCGIRRLGPSRQVAKSRKILESWQLPEK
jgi:hypothetical protein